MLTAETIRNVHQIAELAGEDGTVEDRAAKITALMSHPELAEYAQRYVRRLLIDAENEVRRRLIRQERSRRARLARDAREQVEAEEDQSAHARGFANRSEARSYDSEAAYTQIRTALAFTKEFLSIPFRLRDGREVTWGRAIRSEHEDRAAMLSSQVATMSDEIALHNEVIAILNRTGARCLAEA